MRHTEMGDVRCVALLDLIGIVSLGTPKMNTTTASVRARATLPFTFACLFVT